MINSIILKPLLIDYVLFISHNLRQRIFLTKELLKQAQIFFVETILFFLRLFNDVRDLGFKIQSEERILPHLRPDITVWSGSELLAVIECKTQLGWHRHTWNEHFENRENKIKEKFPKAQVFLVVMSGCNWLGFEEDDKRVGKQLFCLLKDNIWPTHLPAVYTETVLDTPVEKLFDQLVNLRFDNTCLAVQPVDVPKIVLSAYKVIEHDDLEFYSVTYIHKP
jgi:hypothetical protein